MKPKLNINEDFICRIWEGGDSYYRSLVTDSNEDVEIISHGKRNYDAGPDYRDAKVKIAGKIYAGDIEVHRDFKNWAEHSHPRDRRYNSVILHVVMWDSEERTPPKLRIKRDLPSVILANHLTSSIHEIWQDIISKPSDKFRLPCYEAELCHLAGEELIHTWLRMLSMERLKLKSERIIERIKDLTSRGIAAKMNCRVVWEQALYEFIFEALGFSKNKEQMKTLAGNLPLKLFAKHAPGSVIGIQAILYGAGGFMFDVRVKDSYIDEIKSVWRKLEPKLKVPVLERSSWNFYGQRPQNFPTTRLAYGSQVIFKLLNDDLFRKIIGVFENTDFSVKEAVTVLQGLFVPGYDEYWQSHYDLGKKSGAKKVLGGKQRIGDIIVNVILPFAMVYAEVFKASLIGDNAIELYSEHKIRTDNNITRVIAAQLLKGRNIKLNTPAMEQGAIQLYNFYCTREKCDKCEIGKQVFEKRGYDYKIIYY